MTELFIYSDNKALRDLFRDISRSKRYRVTFLPREQLREAAACSADGALIYLDVGGYGKTAARREFRYLASRGCPWAVADPEGVVADPAELFHLGACDYLPPDLLGKRIRSARIHQVMEFTGEEPPAEETNDGNGSRRLSGGAQIIPSGMNWDQVRQGREYTFFFLFIELLPSEEWRVKSGDKNREDLQKRFEDFVRRRTAPDQGKIWMWSDWGGLVLFPFNGENSSPVVLASRLMLNRPLISIEELGVDNLVDYRIALHVGNTHYNPRGDTGEIISEDLNFLFHLGKRQVEKNTLYVTETAYAHVPGGMRPLFTGEGRFEDRLVYRMRQFSF